MARKKTREIYLHTDGKWRLKTTYTTGRCTEVSFNTKEEAQELIDLSDKYHKKTVRAFLEHRIIDGKVTNTGILYHNDGSYDKMLYVRYLNSTYLVYEKDCIIMEATN